MIRFQMKKISVKQFAILAESISSKDINLNTQLGYQYSDEMKLIACEASFSFKVKDELVLLLVVSCEFQIHPDDWNGFIKADGIVLPKELMEILAVHTIGTSRGILFCKTEGTAFAELMLPPINVKKMIEE